MIDTGNQLPTYYRKIAGGLSGQRQIGATSRSRWSGTWFQSFRSDIASACSRESSAAGFPPAPLRHDRGLRPVGLHVVERVRAYCLSPCLPPCLKVRGQIVCTSSGTSAVSQPLSAPPIHENGRLTKALTLQEMKCDPNFEAERNRRPFRRGTRALRCPGTVSYTHLTLPTSDLV